jgi:hypothetical protein
LAVSFSAEQARSDTISMSKRLFISYSKDNYEVAQRLLMHLENQNAVHNKFLDIFLDTKRLKAGYQWDPVIQQNLQCADGYLFLASIDSLSSPYIKTNELPAIAFEHLTNGCPFYLSIMINMLPPPEIIMG